MALSPSRLLVLVAEAGYEPVELAVPTGGPVLAIRDHKAAAHTILAFLVLASADLVEAAEAVRTARSRRDCSGATLVWWPGAEWPRRAA